MGTPLDTYIPPEDQHGILEGIQDAGRRRLSSGVPQWFDASLIGKFCWHAGDEWSGRRLRTFVSAGARVFCGMQCDRCGRQWCVDSNNPAWEK